MGQRGRVGRSRCRVRGRPVGACGRLNAADQARPRCRGGTGGCRGGAGAIVAAAEQPEKNLKPGRSLTWPGRAGSAPAQRSRGTSARRAPRWRPAARCTACSGHGDGGGGGESVGEKDVSTVLAPCMRWRHVCAGTMCGDQALSRSPQPAAHPSARRSGGCGPSQRAREVPKPHHISPRLSRW